jgi:hypothetical protein
MIAHATHHVPEHRESRLPGYRHAADIAAGPTTRRDSPSPRRPRGVRPDRRRPDHGPRRRDTPCSKPGSRRAGPTHPPRTPRPGGTNQARTSGDGALSPTRRWQVTQRAAERQGTHRVSRASCGYGRCRQPPRVAQRIVKQEGEGRWPNPEFWDGQTSDRRAPLASMTPTTNRSPHTPSARKSPSTSGLAATRGRSFGIVSDIAPAERSRFTASSKGAVDAGTDD